MKRTMSTTASWLVPTDFSVQRMTTVLGIPRERIEFIPLAARPLPYPAPDGLPAALDKAGLPRQYLVVFGTIEPRKGIDIILDAWAAQPRSVRDACTMIVAGAPGWGSREFWHRIVSHPVAGEVLATGYVTDTQAAVLLAGARATLLGSRYEGFGLPILESMACGTPVVCSDIPPYREVGGDATARIDPDDGDGWISTLRHAVETPEWSAPLIEAGYEQEQRFSWKQAAERTAAAIDAVARPA
jgi:alpha-1,3-rhamnosyl/mannosyltransferase